MKWNTKHLEKRARRIYGPEEQAMMTKGLKIGRPTLKQLRELERLGVPREKAMGWTLDRASKQIEARNKASASNPMEDEDLLAFLGLNLLPKTS